MDIYYSLSRRRPYSGPIPRCRGDLPLPCRARLATACRGKIMIIGGGNLNVLQALNDVWPSPRDYHTVNRMQNVMMVHGGSDGRECLRTYGISTSVRSTPGLFASRLPLSVALPSQTQKFGAWTQIKPDALHWCLSHTHRHKQVPTFLFMVSTSRTARSIPRNCTSSTSPR